MENHLIIDSDGGVDDILCITLASHLLPKERITVSSIFGNVCVEQASKNLSLLLKILGFPSTPIWQGKSTSEDNFIQTAENIHGKDGLGGFTERCNYELPYILPLENITFERKKYKILSIGPATNIPYIVNQIGIENVIDITLMTGSIFDIGNITEFSEFNAYNDPLSLEKIFNLEIPINIVPLDLCKKIIFSEKNINVLKKFDNASEILIHSHEHYMKQYYTYEGIHGCFPHDSIALLVCFFKNNFFRIKADLEIITKGQERGMIIFKSINNRSNINVFTGGNLKLINLFFNSDMPPKELFSQLERLPPKI